MSRSPSCKRRRADNFSKAKATELSDDEWREIFVRLHVDTLHQIKSVSKHWHLLISDPQFIGRYIRSNRASFQQYNLVLYSKYESCLKTVRDPELISHAIGHIDLSLSQVLMNPKLLDFSLRFLPILRDYHPDPAEIRKELLYHLNDFIVLGASHGLLLCQVFFNRKLNPHDHNCLYVCNPLTKQWLLLPHLPRRSNPFLEPTGFLCHPLGKNSDSEPLNVGFIVVTVDKKYEDGCFITHVFSSETGSWASYNLACPSETIQLRVIQEPFRLAVHDGIFYWYGESCIFAYDPLNQPEICNIINYPRGLSQAHFISNSQQEKLQVIALGLPTQDNYSIWELRDCKEKDGNLWHMIYTFKNTDLTAHCGYGNSTNKEILCLTKNQLDQVMLFDGEDGSPERIRAFTVTVASRKKTGFALPFSLTPWPTPIPQLPQARD